VSGLACGLLTAGPAAFAAHPHGKHAAHPHGKRAAHPHGKHAAHPHGKHAAHPRGKRHPHHRHAIHWTLDIPAIGVVAPVIELGGPRGGRITVPGFAQVWDAGWYRHGAVPGSPGNAVLLGHVDTYSGPAIFYNLYRLLPGELIEVNLGGGVIRRFTVHWVHEMAKRAFPAGMVFGPTRARHLWLITCGGAFDYHARSYLSNILVYATPVRDSRVLPRGNTARHPIAATVGR